MSFYVYLIDSRTILCMWEKFDKYTDRWLNRIQHYASCNNIVCIQMKIANVTIA